MLNWDNECLWHTLSWCYTHVPNIWSASVKPKKDYGPDMKTCQKPYKFDGEVKGQRPIGIMNVHNTSSHDDTPMCQICLAYVKPKTGWTGHESAKTDGRTDRQSDSYIPPWTLFMGGIKKTSLGELMRGSKFVQIKGSYHWGDNSEIKEICWWFVPKPLEQPILNKHH